MSEKKRDAGYHAALTGAKGTVRLLIYVCVILVIILAAKTSYQFGHDVFAEEPVASRGKGKEVTVQVRSGMEAKELGELLKDNGLIDESLLVFEVQYRLSGYYGGIKDGSYVLNTAHWNFPMGFSSSAGKMRAENRPSILSSAACCSA